jgi:hypothetical protein
MIIVIRDGNIGKGDILSPKARFITQLLKETSPDFFYVIREDGAKFAEKWSNNKVELASSNSAMLTYYGMMLLKSPKDFRDGIMRRVFGKHEEKMLVKEGFITVLSQVFYQYFATASRTDRLVAFLNKSNVKLFIIDDFVSANNVDLKMLKRMGAIVYVSEDVAYTRFGYEDHRITKKLMYKIERDAINLADVVIAASERDKLKYQEMGAKKVTFYPNFYPVKGFEPAPKDETPNICIVLQKHWGPRAKQALEESLKALSLVNREITVSSFGIVPQKVPKNVKLKHFSYIPSKADYLKILSRAWIGINVGIHSGGSNERKYDYAFAGLVVLSDKFGCRGDVLPHEFSFIDGHDLAAKLNQLLEFGKERLIEMGVHNREQVLQLAKTQQNEVLTMLNSISGAPR